MFSITRSVYGGPWPANGWRNHDVRLSLEDVDPETATTPNTFVARSGKFIRYILGIFLLCINTPPAVSSPRTRSNLFPSRPKLTTVIPQRDVSVSGHLPQTRSAIEIRYAAVTLRVSWSGSKYRLRRADLSRLSPARACLCEGASGG